MLDRIEWARVRGRKRERGEFRASDADRRDAVRRLEMHLEMGHLDQAEFSNVRLAIDAAKTPNEISKVFVDHELPELPARTPTTEHRVSSQDRVEAIGLLERANAEGRIEADELAFAKGQVDKARTRSEIDAVFHGLTIPRRVAAAETASNVAQQTAKLTTRVVGEGGRRAGKAFRRGALSMGALLIGIILLIAGIGTAALVCFLAAVVLLVSAAFALVTSPSSV